MAVNRRSRPLDGQVLSNAPPLTSIRPTPAPPRVRSHQERRLRAEPSGTAEPFVSAPRPLVGHFWLCRVARS